MDIIQYIYFKVAPDKLLKFCCQRRVRSDNTSKGRPQQKLLFLTEAVAPYVLYFITVSYICFVFYQSFIYETHSNTLNILPQLLSTMQNSLLTEYIQYIFFIIYEH